MDGFKRPRQVRPDAGVSALAQPTSRQLPPVAMGQDVARPAVQTPPQTLTTQDPVQPQPAPKPAPKQPTTESESADKRPMSVTRRKRPLKLIGLFAAILLIVVGVLAVIWYNREIAAANSSDDTAQRFAVTDGMTFAEISSNLKQRDLIRSELAFDIYARLNGERDGIKASTCTLKRSMTTGEILKKLSDGCHDFVSVMFYPGATINKPLYKPADAVIDQSKMYVKYVLEKAGFSDTQIDAALSKSYDSPLFADKPAGTSLEGYVFGETYYVSTEATAEDVLKEAFAEMYRVIQADDLVAKFKAHGLNLYQGITLASIVQRELNCEGKPTEERKQRCYGYQQGIAQVFLNRLKDNMTLGSDVTFIYAADQLGVTPSVGLDSPYNTRKYPGLPPGPIASPGALALQAVGNPSGSDDLFFIAGDDGLIYFAKDAAGHQQNIKNHCQQLCGNAV